MGELDLSSLPRNWKADPVPPRVQAIGDDWVAGGHSAVLRVPSALVPGESNFLLNPGMRTLVSYESARRCRFNSTLVSRVDNLAVKLSHH
jgi:RES domain-containing protein